MRSLVIAIAITSAAPARADEPPGLTPQSHGDVTPQTHGDVMPQTHGNVTHGYYLSEALGGGGYNGELGRYGDGAPRFEVRFGARRGPISVELFGSFMIPDFFYVDCYGDECAYAARPQAGLGMFGVDVRKQWRLLSLQRWGKPGVYERPGVFIALHGGPRWVVGQDAIEGHAGPGLGGGATLEGDLWVIGYFVDLGLDVFHLAGPGDAIRGSTPYVMFGGKVGWL